MVVVSAKDAKANFSDLLDRVLAGKKSLSRTPACPRIATHLTG